MGDGDAGNGATENEEKSNEVPILENGEHAFVFIINEKTCHECVEKMNQLMKDEKMTNGVKKFSIKGDISGLQDKQANEILQFIHKMSSRMSYLPDLFVPSRMFLPPCALLSAVNGGTQVTNMNETNINNNG